MFALLSSSSQYYIEIKILLSKMLLVFWQLYLLKIKFEHLTLVEISQFLKSILVSQIIFHNFLKSKKFYDSINLNIVTGLATVIFLERLKSAVLLQSHLWFRKVWRFFTVRKTLSFHASLAVSVTLVWGLNSDFVVERRRTERNQRRFFLWLQKRYISIHHTAQLISKNWLKCAII